MVYYLKKWQKTKGLPGGEAVNVRSKDISPNKQTNPTRSRQESKSPKAGEVQEKQSDETVKGLDHLTRRNEALFIHDWDYSDLMNQNVAKATSLKLRRLLLSLHMELKLKPNDVKCLSNRLQSKKHKIKTLFIPSRGSLGVTASSNSRKNNRS